VPFRAVPLSAQFFFVLLPTPVPVRGSHSTLPFHLHVCLNPRPTHAPLRLSPSPHRSGLQPCISSTSTGGCGIPPACPPPCPLAATSYPALLQRPIRPQPSLVFFAHLRDERRAWHFAMVPLAPVRATSAREPMVHPSCVSTLIILVPTARNYQTRYPRYPLCRCEAELQARSHHCWAPRSLRQHPSPDPRPPWDHTAIHTNLHHLRECHRGMPLCKTSSQARDPAVFVTQLPRTVGFPLQSFHQPASSYGRFPRTVVSSAGFPVRSFHQPASSHARSPRTVVSSASFLARSVSPHGRFIRQLLRTVVSSAGFLIRSVSLYGRSSTGYFVRTFRHPASHGRFTRRRPGPQVRSSCFLSPI